MKLAVFTVLAFFASFSEIFPKAVAEVNLVAEFNNKEGISGTVTFSQTAANSGVKISIGNLTLQKGDNLTIHKFPVKYIGSVGEVCKLEHVGDVFNPQNDASDCAMGDLTCRFEELVRSKEVTDKNISLSGMKSIFGRSLVVRNSSGHITGCASITSLSPLKTVVGVFRAVSPGIAGSVVLRQDSVNPNSDTSVDINLVLVDARSESKTGLSLTVHENASKSNQEGSCQAIDKLFNPLKKTSCDKRKHKTCPVGDITAKLGPVEVPLPGKGSSHSFSFDTNLPLSGPNSIVGRSLVISENGQPLICATIQEFQELEAEVMLSDKQGLDGIIGFKQVSMYEPAAVNVSTGDQSLEIDIYEQQLPVTASCKISKLGNYWHKITGSGVFDGLTLYGPRSIMFRTLVIKRAGSSEPVCLTILPKKPTYHLKTLANFTGTGEDAVTGYVSLEQVVFNTSKAFASLSSIILDVRYKTDISKKTYYHNWHIHSLAVANDSSMRIGKRCMSTKGHYNPYNVYVEGNEYKSTCNSNSPFRCELGDLSGKLGTYSVGSGMKHLTETENYLASWHNVVGMSVVIHNPDRGAPRFACANFLPQTDSFYSQETLFVKNSPAARNKDDFRETVSKALEISIWRVADVKFKVGKDDDGCLMYSFLLIDDSKSNLHKAFSDLVDDQRDKLKDFAPGCGDTSTKWKISEGKAGEILGVTFGLLALIVLVLCMILWLRKKKQTLDQESKLVVEADGNTVANQGFSGERSDVPDSARPNGQEWRTTTKL